MHKILERAEIEKFCKGLIDDMGKRGLHCEISELKELKTYSPSASVYVIDLKRR